MIRKHFYDVKRNTLEIMIQLIKQYHYELERNIFKTIKLYNIENKREVNKKRNAKHVCEICNGSYNVENNAVHMKTKIHIDASQIMK